MVLSTFEIQAQTCKVVYVLVTDSERAKLVSPQFGHSSGHPVLTVSDCRSPTAVQLATLAVIIWTLFEHVLLKMQQTTVAVRITSNIEIVAWLAANVPGRPVEHLATLALLCIASAIEAIARYHVVSTLSPIHLVTIFGTFSLTAIANFCVVAIVVLDATHFALILADQLAVVTARAGAANCTNMKCTVALAAVGAFEVEVETVAFLSAVHHIITTLARFQHVSKMTGLNVIPQRNGRRECHPSKSGQDHIGHERHVQIRFEQWSQPF